MSEILNNTYKFNKATDYEFDSTKIEVVEVEGLAKLTAPYATDNPIINPKIGIDTDNLTAFSVEENVTTGSAIQYTIKVNGVEKYWDGAAWADSSGYTESNTKTEISDNIASLDLTGGAKVVPIVYLHSETGAETPEIKEVSISYEYYSATSEEPSTCKVNGYLRDSANTVLPNANITAKLQTANFVNKKNYFITSRATTASSNSEGYFEIDLVWSGEFEPPIKYDFVITPFDSENKYTVSDVVIPSLGSVDFDELS